MDFFLIAFVLGVAGLAVMAVGGLGHHGAHGHGHHGDGSHGHGQHGHGHDGHHGQHDVAGGGRDMVLALASPRVVFAVLLGLGAAGLLLRPVLHGGLALLAAALVLGVLFERAAVAPVWRFVERFASTPAQTLETALYDHARAASGFDARGEGLVALELDGQVVQLLGQLRPEDRALRVRAGDRLRVEAVDAERHRCTVSVAGPA